MVTVLLIWLLNTTIIENCHCNGSVCMNDQVDKLNDRINYLSN